MKSDRIKLTLPHNKCRNFVRELYEDTVEKFETNDKLSIVLLPDDVDRYRKGRTDTVKIYSKKEFERIEWNNLIDAWTKIGVETGRGKQDRWYISSLELREIPDPEVSDEWDSEYYPAFLDYTLVVTI